MINEHKSNGTLYKAEHHSYVMAILLQHLLQSFVGVAMCK